MKWKKNNLTRSTRRVALLLTKFHSKNTRRILFSGPKLEESKGKQRLKNSPCSSKGAKIVQFHLQIICCNPPIHSLHLTSHCILLKKHLADSRDSLSMVQLIQVGQINCCCCWGRNNSSSNNNTSSSNNSRHFFLLLTMRLQLQLPSWVTVDGKTQLSSLIHPNSSNSSREMTFFRVPPKILSPSSPEIGAGNNGTSFPSETH